MIMNDPVVMGAIILANYFIGAVCALAGGLRAPIHGMDRKNVIILTIMVLSFGITMTLLVRYECGHQLYGPV